MSTPFMKRFGALAVIATLASMGAGADVVSGGELRKAFAIIQMK